MTAAIYARISRAADEDTLAVDRQIALSRKRLHELGLGEGRVYRDDSRSAWKRDRKRPGWDALLAGIRADQIKTVAIYHGDRLVRQPYDLEELFKVSDLKGVRLISIGGDRDLDNADDRLMLRIEAAVACNASDATSRRLKDKFDQMAATGKAHGGPRPFGLKANRIDHEAAEVEAIRDVAARLLAGESLRSVTAALNASGLVPTGKRKVHTDAAGRVADRPAWSPTTVRQMLLRPSMTGRRFHRGVDVGPAEHDPLLDTDTWSAVTSLLTDPARRTTKTSARRYLLSGIAKCGNCSGALRRTQVHGHARYWCASCFKIAVAQAPLDAFVVGAVTERLRRVPKPKDSKPVANGVGAEIVALKVRVDELTARAADPDAESIDTLLKMISGIERRLAVLREEQAATLQDRVLASVDPSVAGRWDELPLDRQRALVGAVVESLVVRPANGATRFDPARVDLRFREV